MKLTSEYLYGYKSHLRSEPDQVTFEGFPTKQRKVNLQKKFKFLNSALVQFRLNCSNLALIKTDEKEYMTNLILFRPNLF